MPGSRPLSVNDGVLEGLVPAVAHASATPVRRRSMVNALLPWDVHARLTVEPVVALTFNPSGTVGAACAEMLELKSDIADRLCARFSNAPPETGAASASGAQISKLACCKAPLLCAIASSCVHAAR